MGNKRIKKRKSTMEQEEMSFKRVSETGDTLFGSLPCQKIADWKKIMVVVHTVVLLLLCFLGGHVLGQHLDDVANNSSNNPKRLRIKLGHNIWRNEFLLNYTNFNHGSFGACPKRVLGYQSALRLQQEQQPDLWMRSHYKQLLKDVRKDVASLINADSSDNVVLLESASTAVNSVLRSIQWNQGDKIAYFSTAYGMVKHTSAFIEKRLGIDILEIPTGSFPITEGVGNDAFLVPMRQTLDNLREKGELDKLRMVVLDHIVSCPGIKTPVKELATLTKEYAPNAFILVDGAHAVGQVRHLDLQKLGPMDAYLSNGHKWLYSPKGSAFLWMNSTRVTSLFPEPTVISSANQIAVDDDNHLVPLADRYEYTSTRDYTALLSLSAAIDFRQDVLGGDDAIYDYVRHLALTARRYLLELWNTAPLVPESMEEFMINVGLPISDPTVAKELQQDLLEQHGMYAIVVQDHVSGMIYTRLSAQVYLEISDFQRLGQAVLDFIKDRSSSDDGLLSDAAATS